MSSGRHTIVVFLDQILGSEMDCNFMSYLNKIIENIFVKFVNFVNLIGTK